MCCEQTSRGKGVSMPMGCCCPSKHRQFFSKEEETEMLQRYKKELEKEIRGVEQKLKEMKE